MQKNISPAFCGPLASLLQTCGKVQEEESEMLLRTCLANLEAEDRGESEMDETNSETLASSFSFGFLLRLRGRYAAQQ